jgi:hypothetical protein
VLYHWKPHGHILLQFTGISLRCQVGLIFPQDPRQHRCPQRETLQRIIYMAQLSVVCKRNYTGMCRSICDNSVCTFAIHMRSNYLCKTYFKHQCSARRSILACRASRESSLRGTLVSCTEIIHKTLSSGKMLMVNFPTRGQVCFT